MTVTALTLMDPASGLSVPIMPADGISAMILDVAATARTSGTQNQTVYDLVGANGSYDVTQYLTEAAVTLTMALYPPAGGGSIEALWDSISQLLDPSLRPVLIVSNDAWPAGDRQMTLRFNTDTKPFSDPTNWTVQVSWVAPSAVWEDVAQQEYFISAFEPSPNGILVTSTGAIFTSPSATPGGLVMLGEQSDPESIITNGGYAAQWQARLYGPCTGPLFVNDTVGLALNFSGLTLAAGDYIFLDSLLQTAVRASDGGDVTSTLDFTTSDWWLLAAGDNQLRYQPASLGTGGGSLADLTFRSAYKA